MGNDTCSVQHTNTFPLGTVPYFPSRKLASSNIGLSIREGSICSPWPSQSLGAPPSIRVSGLIIKITQGSQGEKLQLWRFFLFWVLFQVVCLLSSFSPSFLPFFLLSFLPFSFFPFHFNFPHGFFLAKVPDILEINSHSMSILPGGRRLKISQLD